MAREVPSDRLHFFYAVYLLCIAGMLGIATRRAPPAGDAHEALARPKESRHATSDGIS